MNPNEKIAYLKGLIEGSDLALGEKEKKILDAFVDALSDLSGEVEEIEADLDDLFDRTDELYDGLSNVEEYLSDEDGCDCGCEDDEFLYDVVCPKCGEKIVIDEDTLLSGDIHCPNCDELLEFDIDGCDCGCEDGCCCTDEDCDCCEGEACDCGEDDENGCCCGDKGKK